MTAALDCCAPEAPEELPEPERESWPYPYSYKPAPVFRGARGTILRARDVIGVPMFGAELEYNGNTYDPRRHHWEVLSAADPEEHRYYLKEDGTVSAGELVTHPGTLEAWRDGSVIDWTVWAVFRALTDCRAQDGCGLHVHVNRTAFTGAPHMYRFVQLLNLNPVPWQTIGRRTARQYGAFRVRDRDPGSIYPRIKDEEGSPLRYVAVNLQPTHTIELRFPQSTLAPSTILATIELLHAAIEHTRERKHSGPPYLWRVFLTDTVLKWIDGGHRRYPAAIPYLRRRALADPATAPAPAHLSPIANW